MKVREIAFLGVVSLGVLTTAASQAASLQEKLCVFQASSKLPAMRYATIGNASIAQLSKDSAASLFATGYPQQDELTKLGFVNYQPGMSDMSKAIASQIAGSTKVVIPVTFAGQTLKFTTDCIWNAAGNLLAMDEGASN